MFSPTALKIIIFGALALHAFAHARALAALIGQALGGQSPLPAELWLLPGLGPSADAALALPFWVAATLGFALAALAFWGIAVPGAWWRGLAIGGAVISMLGIALFFGTWPGSETRFYSLLNTGVAVAMNLVILGSLLLLHRPAVATFGR